MNPKQKQDKAPDLSVKLEANALFRLISVFIATRLTRLIYRIEYINPENIPTQGPALLVANHTSLVDIPAIKYPIKPWIYYVAKKQLFKKKITGFFFRSMGCIAVDRDKVDLQAARGIFSVLQANRIVAMFPQATRVEQDMILKHLPRTGVAHFAIKTGAPIIPVLVDGTFSVFKKTRIIYGPAFTLDADAKTRYTHADLMAFTITIMQKIYDLKDFNYHLTDSTLMEEGIIRRADGTLEDASESEKAAFALISRSAGQVVH